MFVKEACNEGSTGQGFGTVSEYVQRRETEPAWQKLSGTLLIHVYLIMYRRSYYFSTPQSYVDFQDFLGCFGAVVWLDWSQLK